MLEKYKLKEDIAKIKIFLVIINLIISIKERIKLLANKNFQKKL